LLKVEGLGGIAAATAAAVAATAGPVVLPGRPPPGEAASLRVLELAKELP
jgi:hypothetical protein